jgi:hypothetical protein
MSEDYTDAQTAVMHPECRTVDAEDAIGVSETAQWAYAKLYGKRPKEIHLCASRSDNGCWYLSDKWFSYLQRYPQNKTIFCKVHGSNVTFAGWLYHQEIMGRMIPAIAGGHDLYGGLRAMEELA